MARSNNFPEVNLDKYEEYIGIDDIPYNGWTETGEPNYWCRYVWKQTDRERMAAALATSRELIEQQLGYTIFPHWFEETILLDDLSKIYKLSWGMGIEFGTKVSKFIDSPSVSYSDDVGTVIVNYASTLPTDEIEVRYNGEDIIIHHTNVDRLSPTQVMVSIPQCRLMDPSKFKNSKIYYSDISNYVTLVDVYRVYNDDTLTLVDSNGEQLENLEVIWYDKRLGEVCISGCVCNSGCNLCDIQKVFVRYKAGLTYWSAALYSALVRLAHVNLPSEPCGCEGVVQIWKGDREDATATSKVANNPWGLTKGAYFAWNTVSELRLGHGDLLVAP